MDAWEEQFLLELLENPASWSRNRFPRTFEDRALRALRRRALFLRRLRDRLASGDTLLRRVASVDQRFVLTLVHRDHRGARSETALTAWERRWLEEHVGPLDALIP